MAATEVSVAGLVLRRRGGEVALPSWVRQLNWGSAIAVGRRRLQDEDKQNLQVVTTAISRNKLVRSTDTPKDFAGP